MKVFEEIEVLRGTELLEYIKKRAEKIVRRTQGDSWDDMEELECDSIELAHAVYHSMQLMRN